MLSVTFSRYENGQEQEIAGLDLSGAIRVYHAFTYAAGILKQPILDLAIGILKMHDHKGDLTVSWNRTPTDAEIKAFGLAWEECGETVSNVYHEILS